MQILTYSFHIVPTVREVGIHINIFLILMCNTKKLMAHFKWWGEY